MKAILWTLIAALVLAIAATVIALAAVTAVEPAPIEAPAAPVQVRAVADPAQAAPPAPRPPWERYQAQRVTLATCPAGFVPQGGVCVGEGSVAYQQDVKRRQDNKELARAIAEELRDD